MGVQLLTSRAVIGRLYKAIDESMVASWVPMISWFNEDANQLTEEYAFLNRVANMREWIGPRQAKGLSEESVQVPSKEYEDTLEVKRRELRLDKSSQLQLRINELASGAVRHWAQLLSPLINNGANSLNLYGAKSTYDGVDFFGSGHRGSQDNEIGASAATPTRPTSAEMVTGVLQAIETLYGFEDEQGEPANEGMSGVYVMAPRNMYGPLVGALKAMTIQGTGGPVENILGHVGSELTIDGTTNTRLSSTSKIFVFRTDHFFKPFIRQEEEGLMVQAIAEGSEEETKNNRHLYGVHATRGVGYGQWEHAVEVTFS